MKYFESGQENPELFSKEVQAAQATMNMNKEKKAIVAGMVGCLLYVIGDFLFAAIGKNQSADSTGHLLVLALGLVLLREMTKSGELKEVEIRQ